MKYAEVRLEIRKAVNGYIVEVITKDPGFSIKSYVFDDLGAAILFTHALIDNGFEAETKE